MKEQGANRATRSTSRVSSNHHLIKDSLQWTDESRPGRRDELGRVDQLRGSKV